MNLYFSCSLTGGRDDEPIYGTIVDHLLAAGHQVPTASLARPDIMGEERIIDPRIVYQRDMEWIQASDGLIAEVSTPSHGVGYEIAFALGLNKPVLCCYRYGVVVSKMITGNSSPNLRVQAYRDSEQALTLVDEFLTHLAKP
ncbi:MAG: nucleoside 2-deoxyribosyltransferase [Anaerolineales bacterium]|jgi:nucleoside 2-deoxyribosyltransferase